MTNFNKTMLVMGGTAWALSLIFAMMHGGKAKESVLDVSNVAEIEGGTIISYGENGKILCSNDLTLQSGIGDSVLSAFNKVAESNELSRANSGFVGFAENGAALICGCAKGGDIITGGTEGCAPDETVECAETEIETIPQQTLKLTVSVRKGENIVLCSRIRGFYSEYNR
ncbi:MAG: hypothetical protein LBH81_03435 [Rickettsiales bacterium]|nr:hypothetical protein [Rickettsiales bacterium]